MSVIEAAAMRCRTMADGSLRIECEVEPRHAQAAFALFGTPGTPMALAALKPASHEPEKPAEKPKGGLLSQWAAMRCGEPEFQRWLADTHPDKWRHAPGKDKTEKAANIVRGLCAIESRAELDSDAHAQARFDQYIRGPWQRHYAASGATT